MIRQINRNDKGIARAWFDCLNDLCPSMYLWTLSFKINVAYITHTLHNEDRLVLENGRSVEPVVRLTGINLL